MRKYGFLLLVISVLFGQSTIPNTKVRLLNSETVSLNELTNGVGIVSFWQHGVFLVLKKFML